MDARQHDPRALVVQQRDRYRLLAGAPVVGGIAHQHSVRERSARRSPPSAPGEPDAARAAYFSKIARNTALLFSRSFSPGTPSTNTSTLAATPSGTPITGMSTLTVLPGSDFSITCDALNCLPLAVTVTSALTFVSLNSPEFSTVAVNVGLPPPLTWLRVGSGSSLLVATLTPVSALP